LTSVRNIFKELSTTGGTLIRSLIKDGHTIVDVSSAGSEWAEAVLNERQNIRALLYASPKAEREARKKMGLDEAGELNDGSDASGQHLDRDATAEGIAHIHYLHIGSALMARHVLRGAQDMLANARIDFIQLPVDTHDFLTGQALMETLAKRGYELFEIETGEQGGIRLIRYLIFNPNRGRTTVSVLAIQDHLVRQTSLLLLQSALQGSAIQLPEPSPSLSVV
jgi:hypothetical protein